MRPAIPDVTDLVSIRTASTRTGIPRRTLYDWIAKQQVWSTNVDGTLFVHEDDVRRMETETR